MRFIVGCDEANAPDDMQTGCGVRGGVAGGAAGGGELFRRGVRRSPPCVRSCAISFVFWVCRAVAHTAASDGQKHVARLVVLLVVVSSFAVVCDVLRRVSGRVFLVLCPGFVVQKIIYTDQPR